MGPNKQLFAALKAKYRAAQGGTGHIDRHRCAAPGVDPSGTGPVPQLPGNGRAARASIVKNAVVD